MLSRKKLAQIGETRDDRDVIFDVAHRLGLQQAFPWKDRHAYLDWILEDTGMSFNQFKEKDIIMGEMSYRKYKAEGFHTPSGKFEFYSNVMEQEGRPAMPVYLEPPFSPMATPELFQEYPFILMTGTKKLEFFQEHAWWYPEAAPPDCQWKASCVNLLYGDNHFDPDTGAEPLK